MKSAKVELQTALYNRLNGALDCEVLDMVEQNESYPYIEIGEIIENNNAVKCNRTICTVTFHGWDNGTGSRKNLEQIVDDILQTVTVSSDPPETKNFLPLTSFYIVNQFYGSSATIKDLDGMTWHIILTMDFWCEEK